MQTPVNGLEKAEAWANYQKYSAPSKGHQRLDYLIGKWDLSATWQISPEDKPKRMFGTSEFKWILDGRFLYQEVTWKLKNHLAKMIRITGYNNQTDEYEILFIDDVSTEMKIAKGKHDPVSNDLVLIDKEDKNIRTVWKNVVKNNYFICETYKKDESGNEFLAMTLTYIRPDFRKLLEDNATDDKQRQQNNKT